MAKADLSAAFAGFSGRSGGMIFRQLRGKTFVSSRPASKRGKVSAAQQEQRARFGQAHAYARRILADPWQRRVYDALARERNGRADNLLTRDYLTPPVVDEIDVSEYRGQPHDLIRVLATDDIEVVSVSVSIQAATGALIEQGPAAKTHGIWYYRATATTDSPVVVTAIAKDRPGHEGVLKVEWTRS